jgi:hypothetical protein
MSLFTVLLSIYGVMSKQIFRKYIAVLPKNFTFFASIQIQQRLQLILQLTPRGKNLRDPVPMT